MPIPHQRPGPSSLATKNRPRCTNRLRLSALTTESTDGTALRQVQDLIQNKVGKRRIQYPKEYKLGVLSSGEMQMGYLTLEDFTKDVE